VRGRGLVGGVEWPWSGEGQGSSQGQRAARGGIGSCQNWVHAPPGGLQGKLRRSIERGIVQEGSSSSPLLLGQGAEGNV
jgi:hypothetical protein